MGLSHIPLTSDYSCRMTFVPVPVMLNVWAWPLPSPWLERPACRQSTWRAGKSTPSGWMGRGWQPLEQHLCQPALALCHLSTCIQLLRLDGNGLVPWWGLLPPLGWALRLLRVPKALLCHSLPCACGPGTDRLDWSLLRLMWWTLSLCPQSCHFLGALELLSGFFFWLYLSLQRRSSLSSSSGSQSLLMSSLLSRNLMKGTEAELSPRVRDQVIFCLLPQWLFLFFQQTILESFNCSQPIWILLVWTGLYSWSH